MLPSESKCKPPLSGDGFARHYACVTRAAAFRQADLTRALRAMQNADLSITRVEIAPDGTIRIFSARCQSGGSGAAGKPNPLDRFLTRPTAPGELSEASKAALRTADMLKKIKRK